MHLFVVVNLQVDVTAAPFHFVRSDKFWWPEIMQNKYLH